MDGYTRVCTPFSVTIAQGATESGAFPLGALGYALGGFHMPAAFTGTAITFKVSSAEDGTFTPLYDENNAAKSQGVAASRSYQLPSEMFGFMWGKLVSGSAEGAARIIELNLVS